MRTYSTKLGRAALLTLATLAVAAVPAAAQDSTYDTPDAVKTSTSKTTTPAPPRPAAESGVRPDDGPAGSAPRATPGSGAPGDPTVAGTRAGSSSPGTVPVAGTDAGGSRATADPGSGSLPTALAQTGSEPLLVGGAGLVLLAFAGVLWRRRPTT